MQSLFLNILISVLQICQHGQLGIITLIRHSNEMEPMAISPLQWTQLVRQCYNRRKIIFLINCSLSTAAWVLNSEPDPVIIFNLQSKVPFQAGLNIGYKSNNKRWIQEVDGKFQNKNCVYFLLKVKERGTFCPKDYIRSFV